MADTIKVARCKGCPFFTQPSYDVYGSCSILSAEKVGEGQYRSYDIRDTSVLNALSKQPGELVSALTRGHSDRAVRIFYLREHWRDPALDRGFT